MVSENAKRKIDELSKEDLRLEVEKGTRSSFQRDSFAYAKARLKKLEEEGQNAQQQAQLDIAADANEIAKEANVIALDAVTVAKNAWRIAVFSVIVALLSITVTMCSRGQ
jgi:phage host-nuclease inhibitor protein Gam